MLPTVTMTYEDYYKQSFEDAKNKYVNAYMQPLQQFKGIGEIPTELTDLITYVKNLSNSIEQLKSITVPLLTFDPVIAIKDYYSKQEQAQVEKRMSYMTEAEIKRTELTQQHEQDMLDAERYNESLLEPLREKHEQLLTYKDIMTYVFDHYDITPLSMDISDSVSVDEFETLIDESLCTVAKYVRKDGALFAKITSPLKDESNLAFTATYSMIALLLLYILLPIVSIPAFVILFMSVHNMYKDMEKLKIACALMSQIDYKRFVPEDSFKRVADVDTSVIDTELEANLNSIVDYSEEMESAIASLGDGDAAVVKECSDTTNKVKGEYHKLLVSLTEKYTKAKGQLDNILKEYKRFPECQNNSVVMSHEYTLGRFSDELDVRIELPCKNIVFDSTNRDVAINTMKLYLANALLSVRVKQLTVEIYDPKNMCGDFVEFITPDTKAYIKPNKMKLDDLLKTYREYSQQNVLELDNKAIDDYNRDAEIRELVPKEYKLLLIISEFDKLESGEEERLFREYFKFSADTGVMVWLLDNKKYEQSIWVDGAYNAKGEGITYTPEIGKTAVKTFADALRNYKDTGIDYVTKFGDIYIPREKWWTWDTIKGIDMHYGLENGDPTRGLPMTIGDANVHALLGGATGAGKSAAINQILISLITMYPPSELQLVYIDFKNVEAAKFTRGFDLDASAWMTKDAEKELRENKTYYTRVSRIPHLRIISGTTDGEYALSVFEFLMAEMAHRQEIINKFGVTKIEEMRKQILKGYNTEHNTPKGTWADMRKDWEWYKPNVYDKYGDLPRLLVIFDEFQVMYNPEFVEQKIIDMINGKITAITKLARAMAAHFWFTSQSMKGTMSKDTMGNFSLRGALRCTTEVSDELLGNGAAGTIKAKFGFMYTNDSAGQDKEANRFWRVPFLDEKDMPKYIDQLNDMLEEYNEKHNMAEFYDEKILVPDTQLDIWYNNYGDTFNNPDVFILGERANFSTNKAPVTMNLMQDGGENVLLAAFDRNDMMNMTLTLMKQLKRSEGSIMIVNTQDVETYTLMDIENLVDERFVDLASPKQDIPEFIDALDAMVTQREERGGEFTPMYVFCVQWEKCPGISVDANYRLQDQLKAVLRRAPSVGVHFVFSCREKGELPRMLPIACNHRIVGLMPKDCFFFCESPKPEKLPDASKDAGLFAIYEFGTNLSKFRIYQHTYTRVVKSREIVL